MCDPSEANHHALGWLAFADDNVKATVLRRELQLTKTPDCLQRRPLDWPTCSPTVTTAWGLEA
jgi:hypothetical protein